MASSPLTDYFKPHGHRPFADSQSTSAQECLDSSPDLFADVKGKHKDNEAKTYQLADHEVAEAEKALDTFKGVAYASCQRISSIYRIKLISFEIMSWMVLQSRRPTSLCPTWDSRCEL